MKSQRKSAGSIIRIPLPNGKYAFGRILKKSSIAVYDYISNDTQFNIDELLNKNALFIISVYDYIITKGRWKIVEHRPLEETLEILPNKFILDSVNNSEFRLYNPNTGEIKKSTYNDCINLEPAAVWDAEHVEERIIDYFEGKPNKWVETMKIMKPS